MRGIALDKTAERELRRIVSIMSRRGGSKEPPRLAQWSKVQCIKWIEKSGVMKNGIGNFCKDLLRVVIGKTNDGFQIGLGYQEMVKIIQVHYPCSMADEKHLRWYATTMRAAGEIIPVYRERSKWKE